MKRTMGLIFIAVGFILLGVGVVFITKSNKIEEQNTVPASVIASISAENVNKDAVSVSYCEEPTRESVTSDSQRSMKPSDVSQHTAVPEVSEVKSASTGSSTSKEKGEMFENFVVNLLADWRMKLLDRTQDKVSSAGVVAESCQNPDLHVQQKRGNFNVDYYLECKYRSYWRDGVITLEDWQVKRYREFQRKTHRKVLIALGVGGTASNPATLMFVPIDSIKDNTIKKVWVNRFAITPTSEALAKYIDNYFDEVFAASRKRNLNG